MITVMIIMILIAVILMITKSLAQACWWLTRAMRDRHTQSVQGMANLGLGPALPFEGSSTVVLKEGE